MSALAEFPEFIKRLFIIDKANPAGAYLTTLYIRGKPWTFSIDDQIAWDKEHKKPWFSQINNNHIWAALLEKTFAKMIGTYSFIVNENSATAFRALTGSPVDVIPINQNAFGDVWNRINQGDKKGYAMTVRSRNDGTPGKLNSCGLEKNTAYHILMQFDLFVYKLVILRSPKGTSIESYNKRWNFRDTKNWYVTFIDMVPGGINPLSSWK